MILPKKNLHYCNKYIITLHVITPITVIILPTGMKYLTNYILILLAGQLAISLANTDYPCKSSRLICFMKERLYAKTHEHFC